MSDWPNIWHRKEYSKYSLASSLVRQTGKKKSHLGNREEVLVIVPLILICPLFELQHINCLFQQYGSLLYVLGGMLQFYVSLVKTRERERERDQFLQGSLGLTASIYTALHQAAKLLFSWKQKQQQTVEVIKTQTTSIFLLSFMPLPHLNEVNQISVQRVKYYSFCEQVSNFHTKLSTIYSVIKLVKQIEHLLEAGSVLSFREAAETETASLIYRMCYF